MKEKLRIGLIGYKKMGRAHSFAYGNVTKFFPSPFELVMEAVAGRNQVEVSRFATQFGWKEVELDWRRLVARQDIDVIDICAPSDVHDQIAIEAARSGKHILCEKPLAIDSERAGRMLQEVVKAGVNHMVCFNYRFVPAVQQAKQMISEGRLGKIYHFRGSFLQDWLVDPGFPATWRLKREIAGSGALGDLGSHVIDMARFLVGEIKEVCGLAETFVTKRPNAERSDQWEEVTVDDTTAALLRFENGAVGTLEASRYSTGHKSTHQFEIHGEKGSLHFNFQQFNELEFYSREDEEALQGYRKISVTRPHLHPYAAAWWGPGHVIGFENTFVHVALELLHSFRDNRLPTPNFYDGYRCQLVLEAIERSILEKRWVDVLYDDSFISMKEGKA